MLFGAVGGGVTYGSENHCTRDSSRRGAQRGGRAKGWRNHLRRARPHPGGDGGELVLNLREDTRKRLAKTGVRAGLELAAPPGAYHVVIVGQDEATGATTGLAANLMVK